MSNVSGLLNDLTNNPKYKKYRDYRLEKKTNIGKIKNASPKVIDYLKKREEKKLPLIKNLDKVITNNVVANIFGGGKIMDKENIIKAVEKNLGIKPEEARKVYETMQNQKIPEKIKKELEKKLGVSDANVFPEYRKMAETGKITKEGLNKLINRANARKQLNVFLGRDTDNQINVSGGSMAGSLIEGRKGKAALDNAERTNDNVKITHKQIGVHDRQYGISALMHKPVSAADDYSAGGSASAIEQRSTGAAGISSGVGVINRTPTGTRPGMASSGTRIPFGSGFADGYSKRMPSSSNVRSINEFKERRGLGNNFRQPGIGMNQGLKRAA